MGLRNRIMRLAWAAAPQGMAASEELAALRDEVAALRDDVNRLNRDVDEARRDSLRIAELTDLVVERLGEANPSPAGE